MGLKYGSSHKRRRSGNPTCYPYLLTISTAVPCLVLVFVKMQWIDVGNPTLFYPSYMFGTRRRRTKLDVGKHTLGMLLLPLTLAAFACG